LEGAGEKKGEEDDGARKERARLTWKDYVALSVAALETVLAPFVIMVVILFIVVVWLTGHL
jgi:hypothetical protein